MPDIAEPEQIPHPCDLGDSGQGVPLFLEQWKHDGKPPVLLLHGAGAQSGSFRIPGPDPDGNPRSLAHWLHREGFEPWLLDWRGSCRVVDAASAPGSDLLARHPELFDFDRAAELDIPGALEKIREVRGHGVAIGAVGHCMGAGTLAQSIAMGCATKEKPALGGVVLLTLGLFYEPTAESRLKTQGYALELLQRQRKYPAIDARRPIEAWPPPLRTLYERLAAEPHRNSSSDADQICNRLTFMYGAPYAEARLVPEIHRDSWMLGFRAGCSRPGIGDRLHGEQSRAIGQLTHLATRSDAWRDGEAAGVMTLSGGATPRFARGERLVSKDRPIAVVSHEPRYSPAQLPQQFGAIPLAMYAQGAKNVRRGWAARCGANEKDIRLIGPGTAERFLKNVDAVTLITGSENRLWQPRGIHKMHEWLLNAGPDAKRKCERHVVPGFAHQDLLWGVDAPTRIFPKIADGLRRSP